MHGRDFLFRLCPGATRKVSGGLVQQPRLPVPSMACRTRPIALWSACSPAPCTACRRVGYLPRAYSRVRQVKEGSGLTPNLGVHACSGLSHNVLSHAMSFFCMWKEQPVHLLRKPSNIFFADHLCRCSYTDNTVGSFCLFGCSMVRVSAWMEWLRRAVTLLWKSLYRAEPKRSGQPCSLPRRLKLESKKARWHIPCIHQSAAVLYSATPCALPWTCACSDNNVEI